MILYYVIVAVVAALSIVAYVTLGKLPLKKGAEGETAKPPIVSGDLIVKIVGVALAVVFTLRYLIDQEAINETIGLNINSPFPKTDLLSPFISVILLWVTYAAVVATATYPYFKGKLWIWRRR